MDGMDLVFRDVHVTIGRCPVLLGVTGCVKAGQVLGVLGASGAGKSTLLNCISGRISLTSGQITLGKIPLDKRIKRKIGYVLQKDIFFPSLTLHDTLMFAAKLQMPEEMEYDEKMKRLNEIIEYLELNKCLNTTKQKITDFLVDRLNKQNKAIGIGGPFMPGLSGGEKKRANIACELLKGPSVLLLDEPTTGLDSVIAASIIRMLERYAKDFHKTVVVTIHQPSSAIYHTFDNVLLIHRGQNAYFGRAENALPFFKDIGLECEKHYNPADFMLQKVKESEETANIIFVAAQKQRYTAEWAEELRVPHDDRDTSMYGRGRQVYRDKKWPTGMGRQYLTLCHRHVLLSRRKILSQFSLAKTIIVALITALLWYRLPWDESNIHNRAGLLYFTINLWAFGPGTKTVASFEDNVYYIVPEERPIVAKERAAGTYRASAFYLAKMTSEIPLIIVQPIVFMTIVYWMTNVNASFPIYLAHTGTVVLSAMTVQGFALLIGVVIRDLTHGLVALYIFNFFSLTAGTYFWAAWSSIFSVASAASNSMQLNEKEIFGGFYTDDIWFVFGWMKYLSFVHYGYTALLHVEFTYNDPLTCLPANRTTYVVCQNSTYLPTSSSLPLLPNDHVLERLAVPHIIWHNYLTLVGMAVTYRFLGYLCVRYFNAYNMQAPKSRKPTTAKGKEKNVRGNDHKQPEIFIVTRI